MSPVLPPFERPGPRSLVFRTLVVVGLAFALTLGGTLLWTLGRERQRLTEDLRSRAARTADVAHLLLRRQVERGRALVSAISASRAVQDALAERSSSAMFTALTPFRGEFGNILLVVDDLNDRPVAWSVPMAIAALGVAQGGGTGSARFAPVAGDLAVLVDHRIEADGIPLGRVRAAVLSGRLFLHDVSTELDAPLALVHQGRLLHHTFPGEPPLPVAGDGASWPVVAEGDGRTSARVRVDGEDYEIAWRPVDNSDATAWIGAGLPRKAVDSAFARFAALVVASGAGGLVIVLVAVGLFLRAAQQRDEARARSAGLSDRIAHLTAVVHDIKAPLGGIQLRCEGLLEDAGGPPDRSVAAALGQIYETCDRLNLYLVNVLTAAQAEEGPIVPRREVVLLGGLVHELAERVTPLAERRHLRLVLDVAPDVPPLSGDPVLIERALLNLASNAIAATPAGGTVTLFARREGDASVAFGVSDTGPGFGDFTPAEAFSRERPRVKDASLRTGSGLGLFIVARIAEAHGGRALAENRPEGGAAVRVVLPPSDAA